MGWGISILDFLPYIISNVQVSMKNYKTCKQKQKQESVTHTQRGKKEREALRTVFEGAQTVNLADKDFKAVLISMFKAPNVTMLKEVKGGMMAMFQQI